MLEATKMILRTVAADLYTLLMVSAVIYALSFMCHSFERGLIRVLMLIIFVDGLMRVVQYLLGA